MLEILLSSVLSNAVEPAEWTQKADGLVARNFYGFAISNDSLYALGGLDATGTPISTLNKYSRPGNTWSTLINGGTIPTATYNCSLIHYNDALYKLGGNPKNTDVYKYDIATSTWSLLTCTGVVPPAFEKAGCILIGSKIYVVCPDTSTGVQAILHALDLETLVWTKLANPPVSRNYMGWGMVNGKIYGGSGRVGSIYYSDFYEYNPVSDSWAACANIPIGIAFHAVAGYKDEVYVIDGSSRTNQIQIFNPVQNQWRSETLIPPARSYPQVVYDPSGIYLHAGYSGVRLKDLWLFT